MKVSVVDLGVNNIRSIMGALAHEGMAAHVASQPADIGEFCLIPGIGHFGFVAGIMQERGWTEALRAHAGQGRPVLGICLGMQLLFEGSAEAPGVPGLGLLAGEVLDVGSLPLHGERLPVTGWRKLESGDADVGGRNMYFNHSFGMAASHPSCLASYSYGQTRIAAIVGKDRVIGLQFHPEKSGLPGLHLLSQCVRRISKGSF